jgi:exodeoxyribonuclease VII small subunit
MSTDGDVAALTYEQALAELDTLIQRLEGGAVNLDEAIACYERASRLAQHCAELLDRTEQKITQLVVGPSGPQERAFSPDVVPAGQPGPSGAAAEASSFASGESGSGAGNHGTAGSSGAPEGRPARGSAPLPPSVPPPPSAPARARSVRPSSPAPATPALPGLEPPRRREPEFDIDPDDIPF